MPFLIVQDKLRKLNVYPFNDRITIGRNESNDVVLESNTISREHAYITRKEGNGYYLIDGSPTTGKKSMHGVSVRDTPVQSQRLRHNDVIKIVDYSIAFLNDGATEYKSFNDFSDQSEVEPATRLVLSQDEQPLEISDKRLKRLLDASCRLLNDLDGDALVEAALLLAKQLTDASKSVLILKQSDGKLIVHYSDPAKDDSITAQDEKKFFESRRSPFYISRSSIKKVLEKGRTVFLDDPVESAPSAPISVIQHQLKSVICVPLIDQAKKITGCLYIDSPLNASVFTETDRACACKLAKALSALADKIELPQEPIEPAVCAKGLKNFIFRSEAMETLCRTIRKVAKYKIPVLIIGETGCGKEVIARTIHKLSGRKKDYVTVNCGAIPDSLAESELFGCKKGAFNEAKEDRKGYFEQADSGTIFLDEIGDLSQEIQKKILRTIQENEIQRLGSPKPRKCDVRVVAATNLNIENKKVRKKIGFREDLFYRLETVILQVPPLRERKEDIPALVEHFVALFEKENNITPGHYKISQKVMNMLAGYDWPGNVRELKNTIEGALIFSEKKKINPKDLPPKILKKAGPQEKFPPLAEVISEVEKQHIQKALEKAGGKKKDAIKYLEISKDTLNRRIKEYGLD